MLDYQLARREEILLKAMNNRRNHDFFWRQIGGKIAPTPEVANHIVAKARIILDIIPQECRIIADIGCGQGAITNVLAERYALIGVDISQEGLKHLSPETSPILASAGSIPLRDQSVDLVLSSELLEHLPDEVFLKAVSEIKRISRKYILITVPDKENLRKRYTKCNACGAEFHIYGHLRAFNLSKLARYFDDYTIRYFTLCGVPDKKSFNILSYLKNRLANSYFSITSVSLLCPACGKVLDFSFKRNFVQRVILFALTELQRILNLLLKRKAEPDWLVVLFERGKESLEEGVPD